MARIKDLKKEQREVRSVLRKINKDLKEDCYAGRFKVLQTGRKTYNDQNGWCDKTFINIDEHRLYGVAGHGYHLWYHSDFYITLIDEEHPERNITDCYDIYEIKAGMFSGGKTLGRDLNNFIIESDFWDKWSNPDYARTHWYSGENLRDMLNTNKAWKSVDDAIAAGIGRWSNNKEDE